MNPKNSASPCTCILVAFILKWEKKTSLHLEIKSFIDPKNPKNMKWDENETLHWIMRWRWMRWKWNLAFNNDDGKKLYRKLFTNYWQNTIYKNYLHKKINKKINYYPPCPPAFSLSSSLSENRNKIIQKVYYPWIHYTVQNWLSLNKIALQ